MRATRYIADFDSTSSMVYALGRCLAGRGFAGAGVAPSLPRLAGLVNKLPVSTREELYRLAGWWEAWRPERIAEVDAEAVSRWVVEQYPNRSYPGVFIGATHGGAMHLAAALGMPWLPQTFLLPVRRRLDPDELIGDMEWGRGAAHQLMARNPDLAVFHMHDPVHDRLMVTRMAYFRIKRRRLGAIYREFMTRLVPPRQSIVIVDCRLRRQVTRLGPHYTYQVGGLGSTTPAEYLHGGPRVARFLEEQGAAVRSWTSPSPTEHAPEAEWGYLDELDDDIVAFAKERGHAVRRLIFEEPQDLSAVVADMYMAWLRRRGLPATRLIAENFALLAPLHVLRSGAVPFWLPFNTEPGDTALEHYLDARGPFDEIYLMLLSNGVNAIGLVPIERWKELLRRARREGRFLGVDEREFPRDFASFVRYYSELRKHVRARVPTMERLSIEEFERLTSELAPDGRVQWQRHAA
jgi:hypothetical protein